MYISYTKMVAHFCTPQYHLLFKRNPNRFSLNNIESDHRFNFSVFEEESTISKSELNLLPNIGGWKKLTAAGINLANFAVSFPRCWFGTIGHRFSQVLTIYYSTVCTSTCNLHVCTYIVI